MVKRVVAVLGGILGLMFGTAILAMGSRFYPGIWVQSALAILIPIILWRAKWIPRGQARGLVIPLAGLFTASILFSGPPMRILDLEWLSYAATAGLAALGLSSGIKLCAEKSCSGIRPFIVPFFATFAILCFGNTSALSWSLTKLLTKLNLNPSDSGTPYHVIRISIPALLYVGLTICFLRAFSTQPAAIIAKAWRVTATTLLLILVVSIADETLQTINTNHGGAINDVLAEMTCAFLTALAYNFKASKPAQLA